MKVIFMKIIFRKIVFSQDCTQETAFGKNVFRKCLQIADISLQRKTIIKLR